MDIWKHKTRAEIKVIRDKIWAESKIFTTLTPDSEEWLVSRNKLLTLIIPIIVQLVNRYYSVSPAIDRDDMLSESLSNLTEKIYKWDIKKAGFPTWAWMVSKSWLITYMDRHVSPIKVTSRTWITNGLKAVSLDQAALDGVTEMGDILGADPLAPMADTRILTNEYIQSRRDIIAQLDLTKFERDVMELYLAPVERTYREIALILDRKIKAVDNTITRIKHKIAEYMLLNGLGFKTIEERKVERDRLITVLVSQGHTVQTMAKHVGVSQGTIVTSLKKLGLEVKDYAKRRARMRRGGGVASKC